MNEVIQQGSTCVFCDQHIDNLETDDSRADELNIIPLKGKYTLTTVISLRE